jgi:gamma-glutamyltranspeptidase/glutathione hydrolase
MGHRVTSSNGDPVGGFEAILFTPDPSARAAACAPAEAACRRPIAGFYRAGSNFREDGQAVGF